MPNSSERTIQQSLRICPYVAEWLDQRQKGGRFRDRSELIHSLLKSIVDDDLSAHGETVQ